MVNLTTKQLNYIVTETLLRGGFTYPTQPKTGYMVANNDVGAKVHISQFGTEILQSWLHKIDWNQGFIGTWVEGDYVYLDLCECFVDRNYAVLIGLTRSQLAIFDNQNREVIDLSVYVTWSRE